ncbi:MAG: hypothetical protein JXR96_15655 [Deltaproteobacteria bacterium]|nr:hypothetical protein [Deltaproteobacteria bacterium]
MTARRLAIALGLLGLAAGAAALAPGPARPVYAGRASNLRFRHAAHVAENPPLAPDRSKSRIRGAIPAKRPDCAPSAGQDCLACHPGADRRAGSSQRAPRPSHSTCARCHPGAGEQGSPSRCAECHVGPVRRAEPAPASLHFSHRQHAAVPGGCRACHRPEREDARYGLLPGFEACQGCHRDRLDTRRCQACHPQRADGRLELETAGGKLAPRGSHGGDDHRAGWRQGHGATARARAAACQSCHAQTDCDACHRGAARPAALHPADWTLLHAATARADAGRCDACHRAQKDCLRCHRRAAVARTADDHPASMRLHPEGFESGVVHGPRARRNLKACASCHAESDCTRCHGAAGIGLGVCPHPPGWSGRCSLMRARNGRACLKCHSPEQLGRICP